MTAEEIRKHAAGLNGPDGWYHREKLKIRQRALREDESVFGLLLREQMELSVIEAYLGDDGAGRIRLETAAAPDGSAR